MTNHPFDLALLIAVRVRSFRFDQLQLKPARCGKGLLIDEPEAGRYDQRQLQIDSPVRVALMAEPDSVLLGAVLVDVAPILNVFALAPLDVLVAHSAISLERAGADTTEDLR